MPINSPLLFSGPTESDPRPRRFSEPLFEYFNVAAGQKYDSMRTMMERWFLRYPTEHQTQWMHDFKKGQFWSAFFEIYLHELLSKLGYTVIVHPELPSETLKTPDFFVQHQENSQDAFYLEAIVPKDVPAKKENDQKRISLLIDELNTINSPDFFLDVSEVEISSNLPSFHNIKTKVSYWLDSLDWEVAHRAFTNLNFSDLPEIRIAEGEWNIDLMAIPKSTDQRNRDGYRTVATLPVESPNGSARTLRRALKSKATRYGELSHPYIIAVNTLGFSIDTDTEVEVLYGNVQWSTDEQLEAELPLSDERTINAFWLEHGQPTNTRVSGGLIVYGVGPFSAHETTSRLYLNLWAKYPYEGALIQLPHAVMSGNRLSWNEGISPAELLKSDH